MADRHRPAAAATTGNTRSGHDFEARSASVAAWAEDAALSSDLQMGLQTPSALAMAEAAAIEREEQQRRSRTTNMPIRPSATVITRDPVRGTQVTLSIPLDEPTTNAAAATTPARTLRPGESQAETDRPQTPKKKMMRRDSLERREALLKGKEGSRRRQRWENGRLLNNPWAEPPLPSDWEVHPTYPRTVVPYFLAPLWESEAQKRARRQSKAAKAKAKSTVESRSTVLPRDLREKLKRTKSARGLLMDLELEVRRFLEDAYRKQAALESAGLDCVIEEEDESVGKRQRQRQRQQQQQRRGRSRGPTVDENDDDIAIIGSSDEDEDDEEEIVFVGRQGQMKDVPPSPKTKKGGRLSRTTEGSGNGSIDMTERPSTSGTTTATILSATGSDDDMIEIEAGENGGQTLLIQREKLVYGGPEGDQAASFARWIVHSIGDYYGLRTWSVTVGGNPARRDAYVGIDGMMKSGGRRMEAVTRSLPQPLWGMV